MKKRSDKEKSICTFLFFIGLLITVIGSVPMFILKGESIIPVLDQLDEEVVSYYLISKHLFEGIKIYPELMGGVAREAILPSSELTVLFYRLLAPIDAFLVNFLFVSVTAYVGMYLWMGFLTKRPLISFFTACIFAYVPFMSVYGLCSAGVPLVAWAFCRLASDDRTGKTNIVSFLCIILYAAASPLPMSGYVVAGIVLVAGIVMMIPAVKKKAGLQKSLGAYFFGLILLIAVYAIFNLELIAQLFAANGNVSHRSEYVRTSYPLIPMFLATIVDGEGTALSYHECILIEALTLLAIIVVLRLVKKYKSNKESKLFVGLFAATIAIAFLVALFRAEFMIRFMSFFGGFMASFHMERFSVLYPALWYTVLGLVANVFYAAFKDKKVIRYATVLLFIPSACVILMNSYFKENTMEFFREDSTAFSWNDFYSPEEFGEVAGYIRDEEGLGQSEYRVGCLGIDPAVAILNGFYTIDGYSDNYSLEYKHRFRQAIAPELEKSEYNKQYFDNWGNRCYLFSSEYYGNQILTKYMNPYFEDLDFDTEALKDLDMKYLLSAGCIGNAEEKGWKLVKVFDKYEWTYTVYLYEIM